jgi:uncharacterized membrane protein YcaP (DUF421 family)
MVGSDVSLTGGIAAACTLLVVNHLTGAVGRKLPWVERRLVGSPTLLIHDGAIVQEHLRKEGLTSDEVMQSLREHGIAGLSSVKMAVLEVDGTISVVPIDAPTIRTRRRIRGRKLAG